MRNKLIATLLFALLVAACPAITDEEFIDRILDLLTPEQN